MKLGKNALLILCFSIIIISSLLLTVVSRTAEPFENIPVNIGNYISLYFYKLGLCILQKKDFHYDDINEDYIKRTDKKNTSFIKHLPHSIQYDHDDVYNYFLKNGVTYDNMKDRVSTSAWFIADDTMMHFWIGLKQVVHDILDNAFTKSNLVIRVDSPIIHFRCADTPYERNPQYHFPKYSFYKNALKTIADRNGETYKKVLVYSCSSHMSNEKMVKGCSEYADKLCNYLESVGYNAKPECNSNIEDFAKMFYAPGVISIGSSYSFISGFFGNGVFLSTEHIEEKEGVPGCTICNEWTLKGKVKHSQVDDYYDVNAVDKILLT